MEDGGDLQGWGGEWMGFRESGDNVLVKVVYREAVRVIMFFATLAVFGVACHSGMVAIINIAPTENTRMLK